MKTIHTGAMTHQDVCEAISNRRFLPEAEPIQGKPIIVVRGKHCGLTGRCLWRGPNPFVTYHRGGGCNDPEAVHNQQVALMGAEGRKVYVPIENVRVLGFEDDPCANPRVILCLRRVADIAGAHGVAIPGVSVKAVKA